MGNKIDKIFTEMADRDLAICIQEIVELHTTAVLCKGLVRETAEKLKSGIFGDNIGFSQAMDIVEKNVTLEASKRFVKLWFEDLKDMKWPDGEEFDYTP